MCNIGYKLWFFSHTACQHYLFNLPVRVVDFFWQNHDCSARDVRLQQETSFRLQEKKRSKRLNSPREMFKNINTGSWSPNGSILGLCVRVHVIVHVVKLFKLLKAFVILRARVVPRNALIDVWLTKGACTWNNFDDQFWQSKSALWQRPHLHTVHHRHCAVTCSRKMHLLMSDMEKNLGQNLGSEYVVLSESREWVCSSKWI